MRKASSNVSFKNPKSAWVCKNFLNSCLDAFDESQIQSIFAAGIVARGSSIFL